MVDVNTYKCNLCGKAFKMRVPNYHLCPECDTRLNEQKANFKNPAYMKKYNKALKEAAK